MEKNNSWLPAPFKRRKEPTASVVVAPEPPPQEEDQDDVFLRRIAALGKNPDETIKRLPPQRQVLAYAASLQEQMPWFKNHQAQIVNANNLTFPDIPVLRRAYLAEFLRAPGNGEKPCNRRDCESVRKGGFRCRELIIPDVPPVEGFAGWCLLCHLAKTNELYYVCKNRKSTLASVEVIQIHCFMVMVDCVGEYRLGATLPGDDAVKGLFGPFPMYNERWYHPADLASGLKGWIEDDRMVFRLSRTA